VSETSYLNHSSSEISIIEGTKNELIVFNSDNDKDSFLELLKLNNQNNGRTLVTLNYNENTGSFVERFKNYDGKIFLCLTGDDDGNRSTQKILNEFQNKNIKDIRLLYGISENGNQNLEEYLKNKLQVQEKNTTLVEQKTIRNEDDGTQSEGISDTQHLGAELSQRNSGESNQTSKPKQNGNHFGGQAVDGNHAGNGLEDTIWKHLVGKPERGPVDGTQPQNAAKNEGAEHSLGGIVSGRNVSNRIAEIVKTSTQNNEALGVLISKYKGQKLTNEQVAEVVSAACFVSSDKQVKLKESLNITEDLKEICHQFKSGGTAKEGRGILDEYYTDSRIVDAVRNLIKDQFKNRQEISVLEPSVGTGNFLYAVKELGIKSNITAFEINEITAKIAKILHPESDIHLRSFETEFSDEKGNKKKFSEKYDLVIGNPPYGDHRGLYKGLGEEPKISKYEDYFVKRSLDSLKPDGVLAMVLPSGWLNRQTQLKNAEILEGFRLPNGAFAGTQVGTDIIILRKNSQKISTDISNYFEKHPDRILGETREKTNRFGRLENYVYGNLEDALSRIEQLKNKKQTERIGNLFEDLFLEVDQPKGESKSKTLEKTIPAKTEEIDLAETKDKIEQVLSRLNEVKFKSPAIEKEIEKYFKLQTQIFDNPPNFSKDQIDEIHRKADKIIHSHKEKNAEYRIQTKPEIKKGILKYHFKKPDEIVNASLQNSTDITKEQIEAFRDTSYDGTLNNHGKHYQFANYMDGNWVHDFYYAEGNIYAKLEQLEIDFKDRFSVGGTENQYEKQKDLLLNVLPKPKTLDEISISPNHEFVHQFDLGTIEKERWNQNTRQTETVTVPYNLAEKFKDFVGTLSSEAFAGSSSWEVRSFVEQRKRYRKRQGTECLGSRKTKSRRQRLVSKIFEGRIVGRFKEAFCQ